SQSLYAVSPVPDTSRLPLALPGDSGVVFPLILRANGSGTPVVPPSPHVPLATCRPSPGELPLYTFLIASRSATAAPARAVALRPSQRVRSARVVTGLPRHDPGGRSSPLAHIPQAPHGH